MCVTCVFVIVSICACVHVCMCAYVRERDRQTDRQTDRQSLILDSERLNILLRAIATCFFLPHFDLKKKSCVQTISDSLCFSQSDPSTCDVRVKVKRCLTISSSSVGGVGEGWGVETAL